MLKFLAMCFLSFTVTGGGAIPYGDISTFGLDYDIANISYEECEIGWHWEGLIGRHEMIQITDCKELGKQSIQKFSNWYSGTGLTDFTFTDTFTTVYSTTVSTTEQLSSKLSTGLQMQAGITGATIKSDAKVESVYTISQTTTYTASETTTLTVNYKAKPEYIEGKEFALGLVADVYEITWKSWQWDDWWWGDYVVEGSEATHTAYLTIDPTTTIIYKDGSFVI